MTASERRELRELVERYAQSVDRADAEAVAQLFAEEGELVLWMVPGAAEPVTHRGRAEIEAALSRLGRYTATHHTISSHTSAVDGLHAHGETMCTAHHVTTAPSGAVDAARSQDRVLYIRYLDTFVRTTGAWLFARREFHVQWVSTLPVDD